MSLTVAEIQARFTGDASSVVRAARQVSQEVTRMEQVSGSAGGSLRRIFEVTGGIAAFQALSGVTSKVKELGRESIFVAGRVQEMTTVLGILGDKTGHSGQALDEQVSKIKQLGIETGVAQDTVSTFIRYNLDLAQSSKIARVAQDAAVFSQENSSQTLQKIIYGIQTHNTEVLRTAGINVNLEQSYGKLASSLHKQSDELTEGERLQAALNAVQAEGSKIAGSYEAAQSQPLKQMRSLAREATDAKEAVGGGLLPAFAAVIKFSSAFLKGITEMTGAGTAFRTTITRLSEGFAEKVNAMTEGWKKLVARVKDIGPGQAEEFFRRIQGLGAALIPILGAISLKFSGLGTIMGRFQPFAMVATVGAALASTKEGQDALKQLGESVSGALASSMPALAQAFASLGQAIATALPPLVELVAKLVEAGAPLATAAAQMAASLAPALQAIVPLFATLAEFLGHNQVLLQAIIGIAVARWFTGWISPLRDNIRELGLFGGTLASIKRQAEETDRAVGAVGQSAANAASNAVPLGQLSPGAQAALRSQVTGGANRQAETAARVASMAEARSAMASLGGLRGVEAPVARVGQAAAIAGPQVGVLGRAVESMKESLAGVRSVASSAGSALMGAMGGPVGIAVAGLAVGLQIVFTKLAQNREEARKFGEEAAKSLSRTNPEANRSGLEAAHRRYEELRRKVREASPEEHAKTRGMDAGIGGFVSDLLKNNKVDEYKKEYEKLQNTFETQPKRLTARGMEILGGEGIHVTAQQFGAMAERVKADLTAIGTAGTTETEKVVKALREAANSMGGLNLVSGRTAEEWARNVEKMRDDSNTFVDAVKKNFTLDFGQFLGKSAKELNEVWTDAKARADEVAKANQGVADSIADVEKAQRSVQDAQRGATDAAKDYQIALRHGTGLDPKSVEAAEKVRDAQDKIKDALHGVKEAEDKVKAAREQATKAGQQEQGFIESFGRQIRTNQGFLDNYQKLLAKGLDPKTLNDLFMQGPEKAGGLLEAMVGNYSDKFLQMFNDSVDAMTKIQNKAGDIARAGFIVQKANEKAFGQGGTAADQQQARRMAGDVGIAAGIEGVLRERPGAQVPEIIRTLQGQGMKGVTPEKVSQVMGDFAQKVLDKSDEWASAVGINQDAIKTNAGGVADAFAHAKSGIDDKGQAAVDALNTLAVKFMAAASTYGVTADQIANDFATRRGANGPGSAPAPSTPADPSDRWGVFGRAHEANAMGNIMRFFGEGGTVGKMESHIAQIARPSSTMRVWAEPETGGEAYIPLAEAKRTRSTGILADVAQRFGYQLTKMAAGGVLQSSPVSIGPGHAVAPGGSVTTSNTTQYNFAGANFAVADPKRFSDEMERQARLRELSGGV